MQIKKAINMNTLNIVIYLLPIVFIIHDFEEIIGVEKWLKKNGECMKRKYPKLTMRMQHLETLSSQTFAVAVLEEFLIISTVTICTLLFSYYFVWIAVFSAFSFHIMIHIVQWIIIKKYIPVIVTSLLSIPYIVLGMLCIIHLFSHKDIILCSLIGILVASLNLLLVHKLIAKFSRRE